MQFWSLLECDLHSSQLTDVMHLLQWNNLFGMSEKDCDSFGQKMLHVSRLWTLLP